MKPHKYIIANKEQELALLGELEAKGFKWLNHDSPQEWLPSKEVFSDFDFNFPYLIVAYDDRTIIWSSNLEGSNGKVVFDGRKDEKMTEKYKVTQEFIVALIKWQDTYSLDATSGYGLTYMVSSDLAELPRVAKAWWEADKNPMERNRRLIAIIRWLNGDDSVFEVEKPHKFVVRSENTDSCGKYSYLTVFDGITITSPYLANATRFSAREKAQEWANSHQVVTEVDA